MSNVSNAAVGSSGTPIASTRSVGTHMASGNVRSTWMALRITFSIVPIVAGLDKFTNLLTNWENYLNPALVNLIPVSPHVFMEVVGVIEIVAGLVVFSRPRLGALIVTAWLGCISLSLLVSGHYLDVAVRDAVMAVSALALARLTSVIELSGQAER
jgi:hypothetical protein